jgi:hypothetical protein
MRQPGLTHQICDPTYDIYQDNPIERKNKKITKPHPQQT